nr:PilZ domain of bacterial signalling proteins [uncultured bacterium]
MQPDALDRRRHIRVKWPFTIHVYPAHRPPLSAYTEDISETGVRVTVHEPIPVASVVGVVMYVNRQPIACKAEVKWLNKRESRFIESGVFFDIGMQFIDLSAHDRQSIADRVDAIATQQQWSQQKSSPDSI